MLEDQNASPQTTLPKITTSDAVAVLSDATGLTRIDAAQALAEIINRDWRLVPLTWVRTGEESQQ